ncbi:hypothetical protein EDB85DRAFT_1892695 [Lactarius pseudohatsudake]|nr:hypothetical protein EDB85DRAFT_1892695 [Lactarius pseudohatsudake]
MSLWGTIAHAAGACSGCNQAQMHATCGYLQGSNYQCESGPIKSHFVPTVNGIVLTWNRHGPLLWLENDSFSLVTETSLMRWFDDEEESPFLFNLKSSLTLHTKGPKILPEVAILVPSPSGPRFERLNSDERAIRLHTLSEIQCYGMPEQAQYNNTYKPKTGWKYFEEKVVCPAENLMRLLGFHVEIELHVQVVVSRRGRRLFDDPLGSWHLVCEVLNAGDWSSWG